MFQTVKTYFSLLLSLNLPLKCVLQIKNIFCLNFVKHLNIILNISKIELNIVFEKINCLKLLKHKF